ncbi:MAG: gamma-glutamyltransferase, partial [Alphaproteobacteria bacterium]
LLDAEPGLSAGEAPAGADVAASSTTHLSVVDAEGNAVALTSSIETSFGSRVMVRGFLLNNQLTDFAFRPVRDGRPVANRAEPGKRPLSAMAPTIVLDRARRLVMVVGSPGGPRIIPYVAQTIVGVLDWKLDIQRAIELPHVVNLDGATELEAGTAAAALLPELARRGHLVELRRHESGLHAIVLAEERLEGGADPRRGGVALGE